MGDSREGRWKGLSRRLGAFSGGEETRHPRFVNRGVRGWEKNESWSTLIQKNTHQKKRGEISSERNPEKIISWVGRGGAPWKGRDLKGEKNGGGLYLDSQRVFEIDGGGG